MFRNLQPDELKTISNQLDCYNYLMNEHYTNDPQSPRYNIYPPNNKQTRKDLENQERINKAIKDYKDSINNKNPKIYNKIEDYITVNQFNET